MPNVRDIADSLAVAEKIVRAFRLPWRVGRERIRVTASVGFARFPDDYAGERRLCWPPPTMPCGAPRSWGVTATSSPTPR